MLQQCKFWRHCRDNDKKVHVILSPLRVTQTGENTLILNKKPYFPISTLVQTNFNLSSTLLPYSVSNKLIRSKSIYYTFLLRFRKDKVFSENKFWLFRPKWDIWKGLSIFSLGRWESLCSSESSASDSDRREYLQLYKNLIFLCQP